MTNSQLYRAVARATGDDRFVIMSRGFSLVDETPSIDAEDLEALIMDWDRVRDEEGLSRSRDLVTLSKLSQKSKRRPRQRRIVVTSH